MDRSKHRRTRKGDAKFIKGVTKEFGSREIASKVWVEQGFKFYFNNKLSIAMRRFNQAWLLKPNNPEIYVGFAGVLYSQGDVCKSMDFSNTALTLPPPTDQGIYPDTARVVVLCALNDHSLSEMNHVRFTRRFDAKGHVCCSN